MEEVKEVKELKIWSTNRDKHYGAIRVKMNEGYGAWRVKRVFELKGVHVFVESEEEEEMQLQQDWCFVSLWSVINFIDIFER